MKLSDVITPGDKIDIKMLHEANQEDNGGEIAKIYQSAVSDIFSDQELAVSLGKRGGCMVLFALAFLPKSFLLDYLLFSVIAVINGPGSDHSLYAPTHPLLFAYIPL